MYNTDVQSCSNSLKVFNLLFDPWIQWDSFVTVCISRPFATVEFVLFWIWDNSKFSLTLVLEPSIQGDGSVAVCALVGHSQLWNLSYFDF